MFPRLLDMEQRRRPLASALADVLSDAGLASVSVTSLPPGPVIERDRWTVWRAERQRS